MPAIDNKSISRRRFLKKTGWVAIGVTVVAAVSYPLVRSAVPAFPTLADPVSEDGFAWVQALPDGRIRFFCPRMEMGQGSPLGLCQIVAEELNIDQSGIECVLPDTNQVPPFKLTVGSEGIAKFFEPVSLGAALLREKLRAMAADRAGLSKDLVKDGRGGFILPSGNEFGYGELVPSEAIVLSASDYPKSGKALPRYAVQRRGKYHTIGQSWKHHELEAIVTGQTVYARDVSLPDMLYGQVLRPPALGAQLSAVDDRATRAMPGIVDVIINKGNSFIGVVAENPFLLPAAMEVIKVQWEIPEGLNQDQFDASLDVKQHQSRDDFEHVLASDGDISIGKHQAQYKAAARYSTSFAAHAAIEPRSGVARVEKDTVEIWCGSQDPFFVQQRVAKTIRREADDVIVYSHRMGGGFGGRVVCQASEEAAILSTAVGRPVRVQWDRETEFQHNYFQPSFSHHIDASVTGDGKISHWQHDFVSSPILTGLVPQSIGWALDKVLADEGTARGSLPQYQMTNRQVRYSDIRTPVPVGAWRGLGSAPNTFAIESMMDELAGKAGIDPLKFRFQNLPSTSGRLTAVLHRVAEISGWGRPSPKDIGLGIACAVYKNETAVAIVAEVQIDREAHELRVGKIWCAQDSGLVINPDQVENQIMGNIIWGCSMALKERITFEEGAVEQRNFHTYEILRHDEAPKIEVALVIPPGVAPVAVGESALAPVAPAIANAVFAAAGKRVRQLPMDYDSIFQMSKGGVRDALSRNYFAVELPG